MRFSRFVATFVSFAGLSAALTACGAPEGSTGPAVADRQAAGAEVRALGVAAYEVASTGPGDLVARLVDTDGTVGGEVARLGSGATLAFELLDAEGRQVLLSLGAAPAAPGAPASEETRGVTVDGAKAAWEEGRLLRAIALDPAFHALAPSAEGSLDVEATARALRAGGGPTTEQRRCWDGCADDYLDCQFGRYPEVCDDVYDACIRICDFIYPRSISVGGVYLGTVSASLAP
jgi:hypothetical protein